MNKYLFSIGAMLILSFVSLAKETIYISPYGSDSNTGNETNPLKTMAKAIVLSRSERVKRICVMGGNYYNVHFQILPEDSGLIIEACKNEKPFFFGGKRILNWSQEDHLLVAKIDSVDDVRFFTVNNQPRERSRLPEKGSFRHRNTWNSKWLSSSAGGWDKQPTDEQLTTLLYEKGDLGGWFDFTNAEVSVYHEWDESQSGIDKMDTVLSSLTLSSKLTHPPGAFVDWNKNADKYVIYNIKQGVNKSGRWFFDKQTSLLYYYPFEDESADNINGVCPTYSNIVYFASGTSDIVIRGITFSTTTTPLVNPGYAATFIDASIKTGSGLKNIIFEEVTVENHAGWGVNCSGDNIRFVDCVLRNLGAGGIKYNGTNISIERTVFHDLGLIYKGAVGILGSGSRNSIIHSEFYDIPYCAINNIGNKSQVEGCLFYDVKTFMQDGGAIYQIAGDSVIYKNNVTFNNKENSVDVLAYYFDENSTRCAAYNNLAINTKRPLNSHMANDITFSQNVFIDTHKQVLPFTRSSNITFEDNILIADTIVFQTPVKGYAESHDPDLSGINDTMKPFVFANGIISLKDNQFYTSVQGVLRHKIVHGFEKLDKFEPLERTDKNLFIEQCVIDLRRGGLKIIENNNNNSRIDFSQFYDVGCTDRFDELFVRFY